MKWRPLALLVMLPVIGACSANAPAGYTEGRVGVTDNVITLDDRPLPSTVPDDVAQRLKGFQGFDVGISYRGSNAEIVSPVTDEWQQVTSLNRDTARLKELTAAYEAVDKNLLTLGSRPTRSHAELQGLFRGYRTLETAAYEAAAAEMDPRMRQAYVSLAAESGEILMMGYPTSNATDLDIDGVADSRRGAAAVMNSTTFAGSGFLVATNWVVTNRHVVAGLTNFKTLSVVLPADAKNKIPARECTVVERKVADSQSPLDLAALQFRCAQPVPASWVLKLSDRHAERGDLLYIHAFSTSKDKRDFVYPVKVRYPHKLTDSLRNGLRMELSAPALAQFDKYYLRCDPPSTWCYLSSEDKWGTGRSDANIPTMGFDSNTQPGNSGSPVISAVEHQVVGVLFAGAKDHNVNLPFSFERHEAAIPSPIVASWLKSVRVLP